jgi:hypothetical protein
MLTEWSLHYPRWLIGDGYLNRSVGATFEWFNVEFWADEPLKSGGVRSKTAIPIADFRYKIIGEVEFLSDEGCLVDFGLRAMGVRSTLASDCKKGDYVTGEVGIGLGLDIQFLPEDVFSTLKCKWHINRITADLTPLSSDPDNAGCFIRDESRIQYVDVKSTLEVKVRDYILHCAEVR